MRANLKLFVGDDERQRGNSAETPATVSLEEFARVLSDAVSWDRTWLQDFADEPMIISQDLYEIIRMSQEIDQLRA